MNNFTELVGGAIISTLVQMLVERIASPEVVNYLLGKKDSAFDGLLKRLKMMMSSLSAVLDDAEHRQIRNDPAVEAWLDDVQEAVFDSDDLLDEIETDALRLKVEAESSAGPSEVRESKRLKMFHFSFRSRRPNDGDMEGRVQKLIQKLEGIAKQKDLLGLRESTVEKKPWRRLPSTSLVEECEVYGRDDDKAKMMELLLNDDVGSEKIHVIPVVGMDGVGKTALAQSVFNDCRVQKHFELKAWVCVSEEFDVCRLTSALLQLESSSSDMNSLQVKLKEKLCGKKFLIVLDDVWNESYLDWDILRMPFKDGAKGSKIIVSTRSNKVASVMGTIPSHQLKELSDEACWKLFAKHASGIGDFITNPELETIGREIVGKCKGLPLAVKALGGLLRSTMDVREWKRVSKSDLWELTDVQSKILPALRLSYYYLPSSLKRCFAYCSIFPKDYQFNKEEWILLWMAENLLLDPNKNNRMEELGDEYFNDLVSRSFLQQSRNSKGKSFFVIHDLLVDLAKSVSGKYFFLSESSGSLDKCSVAQVRHFTYVSGQYDTDDRYFRFIFGATHLQTFLSLSEQLKFLSKEVSDDLFLKLTCLRVLSISGYTSITQLPDSIGDLRHLRYLNFSNTSIRCLPESTSTLYNLQTLKLALCFFLTELPKELNRLINLRHLDLTCSALKELPQSLSLLSNLQTLKLSKCGYLTKLPKDFHRLTNLRNLEVEGSSLEEMPTQISELIRLETLDAFFVGNGSGAKIEELRGFSDLRGTLHIKNLQNVVKPEEALEAELSEKTFLEELKLEWVNGTEACMQEKEVLDHLAPNTNLKKLEIIYYRGAEFPRWLGNESFRNMVYMQLSNCNYCSILPPIGQLSSLKKLQINRFDSVVRVGPEFYGNSSSTLEPFASLAVLEIDEMPKWKEWLNPGRDSGVFPKLRQLSIRNCNSLTGVLPSFLPSLTALTISMCDQFVPSLPEMPNVSEINLTKCKNLSRAMESHVLESFTHLHHLDICGNIPTLQLKCLPASMRMLSIQSDVGLELQIQQRHDSLEELSLACDMGSVCFPLDSCPNIRDLQISGCKNLESLWARSSEGLRSLSTLNIFNNPNFTIFLESGPSCPNLTYLGVYNCAVLKSLPGQMHNLFQSLDFLEIYGCPALDSFPMSGLPSGLRSIAITNCDKLVASRMNWNLQRLSGLKKLSICECKCEDIESFPEEVLLPSTLTHLFICEIKCMKILDNKQLLKLTSLKELHINHCPNLQTMSDARLPASLEILDVSKCLMLEEKCRREIGECWSNIAHIPRILIDSQLV